MPDKALPESTYPPLERPTFQSQIPAHLLVDASPAEQHIMSELNILRQCAEWSTNAHLETNRLVRKTNGRLLKAEEDIEEMKDERKSFITGWRAIVAVTGFIMGFVSFIALIWTSFLSGN